MKTFKLTVTEDELKALIWYNSKNHAESAFEGEIPNTETSARIHDLTKRLNRTTPEIEPSAQEQSAAEQVKIPEGW